MSSTSSRWFFRLAETITLRHILLPISTLALVAALSVFLGVPSARHHGGQHGAMASPASTAATDRAAIAERLSMLAGCFTVRYQFVEDGRGDYFLDDIVESVKVVPRGQGFVATNHIFFEDGGSLLHWHQEWQPLDDGRWHLTVRNGDGTFRYQSAGVWRFNQWEGEAALAAKPTRDHRRDDYDALERRNIIQFTQGQWVHSEINTKRRADGTPVASELGWITYAARDDDTACTQAQRASARTRTTKSVSLSALPGGPLATPSP